MGLLRDLAPVYLAGHVMVVGFQSCYPTSWLLVERLGGSKAFYGWTVSAYMLMALASSLVFGKLTTRQRLKPLLLTGFFVSMTGYVLYAFAQHNWMVMLGRLLSGFGFGSAGLCLTWIAFATPESDRTKAIAIFSSCQFFGAVVGPIMGSGVTEIPFHKYGLPIHPDAAAGLLGCVEALVLLAVLLVFLDPAQVVSDSEAETGKLLATRNAPGSPTSSPRHQNVDEESASVAFSVQQPDQPVLDRGAAAVLMLVYFTVQVTMGGTEAAFAPMTNEYFQWSQFDNGVLYSCMFFLGFLGSSSVQWTGVKFGENLTLAASQLVQVGGLFIFIKYSAGFTAAQFIIAVVVFTAGFSSTFSAVVAFYSKCIPSKQQGVWMGYFGLVSSAGRIVGPLYQGYVIKVSINAIFYGLLALATVSTFAQLVAYARLGRAAQQASDERSDEPRPGRLRAEMSASSLNSNQVKMF